MVTAFEFQAQAQAMVVSATFLPADAPEEQIREARAVWRTIGDLGIGAYAGFLGSDTPEDIDALWPAETLKRLRQVKRTWDPHNTFRRNHNVVP